MKLWLATILVLVSVVKAFTQETLVLTNAVGSWRALIDVHGGSLRSVEVVQDGKTELIQFRTNQFAGPSWSGVLLNPKDTNALLFQAQTNDVIYTLQYRAIDGHLAIVAGLENAGETIFSPRYARLVLGLDTEMIRYPQWNDVFFPTLLRCERTHFWGYFMGPTGRILGIASPDAIASYSLEYKQNGHRIYTCNLDVLHALPLPERHPQSLTSLKPGERKTWTIFLEPLNPLDQVKPHLAALARAPMIEAERYTLAEGEGTILNIFAASRPEVIVIAPDISTNVSGEKLISRKQADGSWAAELKPHCGPGVYKVTVSVGEKIGEAKIYVRKPWSWYLQRARAEALTKPQKASTHRESWVGCFSTTLAERFFPDAAIDAPAEKMFQELFGLMYDQQTAKPLPASDPGRSQNHSVMISLLATRFAATGNTNELDFAARLADWLIANRQADDGSYRARSKTGVHYTSVHYMAKNILELAVQEEKLAVNSTLWRDRYQRHFASAKRAIDDLLNRGDRVETEGEQTLEDSMIANTAAQLGLFALLQKDSVEREKYQRAAQHMHDKHQCLSQLEIPDCRMRGGTLRFWEAQYDVLMKPNMMNSPHGWTARKTPGTWYLYLLTGEERYLRETMDAVGACMQLIDLNSGELRWAFVPDPYIEADVFAPDTAQPGNGEKVKQIVGEQYIPMISGWWKAPAGRAVRGYSRDIPGSCCDNDVHEVFKAMVEIALTSAYVLERSDGELVTWNCSVRREGNVLVITPAEAVVSRVHLNFKSRHSVRARFVQGAEVKGDFAGMTWIGSGGVPELLRAGEPTGK